MKECVSLGIDTFVRSGYPHLEDACRFAESVLPLLPLAAGTRGPADGAGHDGSFGEMIGNTIAPGIAMRRHPDGTTGGEDPAC